MEEYLQTLMNLINAGEEVDERRFPWPYEYHTLYALKQKFPQRYISLNEFRQILEEEFALRNIKMYEDLPA